MSIDRDKNPSGAKVPVEKPDPKAAKRPPRPDAKDRPGFDLGGAKDKPGKERKVELEVVELACPRSQTIGVVERFEEG